MTIEYFGNKYYNLKDKVKYCNKNMLSSRKIIIRYYKAYERRQDIEKKTYSFYYSDDN